MTDVHLQPLTGGAGVVSYPLTPMQQGMLFHALSAPSADVYFGQAHWVLHTDLDIPAFHRAWQEVADRHAALRSSFEWTSRDGPWQVVHSRVRVPLDVEDWRQFSRDQQAARLEGFLHQDRARGFALHSVPLLRLTLFRLADDEYRIVWSGHHLLVDGRSLAIVLREVLTLYDGYLAGVAAPLPPPTPYQVFIDWLHEQDGPAARSFWHAQLQGLGCPMSITSRGRRWPRPDREGPAAATETLEIVVERELRLRLFALAHAAGVTLNTVILGAWALVLSDVCGRDDVVFGVTVGSGGTDAPLRRSLVGLLINTVPLRIAVCPQDPLPAFLRALRSRMLGAQRFAYAPLVDIHRASGLPPATPLFDTIVVCDNAAIDRLAKLPGGLRLDSLHVVQHSSYPLNLVVRRGAELRLRLIWDDQYCARDDVACLASQLELCLDAMGARPQGPLQDVIPGSLGRSRPRPVPPSAKLPPDGIPYRLFEAQVRRSPDACAVVAAAGTLTYDQLNRRANRLAHTLGERGIGPGTVVGMAVPRGIDLVVALVGIAKAGAASLLLDPEAPPERLTFMLADARARVVVTTSDRVDGVGNTAWPLVLDRDLPGGNDDRNPEVPIGTHSLAHVVYTSGSTGMPKGVMVEHGGLANLVAWHRKAFAVVASDRATQLVLPSFDAHLWEVWPYLAAGASIHLPADDVRIAPRLLRDWLLTQHITISFLPTPLAEAVLALDWPVDAALRAMLVGGDVLHTAPASTVPFAVFNNYGPTECTVVATSGQVAPGSPLPPSIGRPIDEVEVHILDDQLQPVPPGTPGEMWIGGAGVSRGYLKRPELTAERFRSLPAIASGQLFRTGDLARRRRDGEIEFLGRMDNQVKIRGFRIELGEIEWALRRCPGVRQATVVAREDQQRGSELVAYIVAEAEEPSPRRVRRYLQRSLPAYMIPRAYVCVPALPMTAHGKIDRDALSRRAPPAGSREGRRLRTAEERALAGVWAEVLGVDGIGPADDFFELGGDSLRAVELVERLRSRLAFDLVPSDLFRAPTIEELIRLRRGASPHTSPVLVPMQPHGRRLPFFCAAPVLGTVFPYYGLAHLLGQEQPFYALQPIGLPDGSATVEALATAYLAALRCVQPGGPYHLGGWSFGGLVAFEMAQQLSRQGERVALLAIIDTPAPAARRRDAVRHLHRAMIRPLWDYAGDYQILVREAARAKRLPSRGRSHQLRRSRLFVALQTVLERSAVAVVPPESRLLLDHPPTIRQMLSSLRLGVAASLRYRPQVYAGPITVLCAAGATPHQGNPFLGWETLGDSIALHHTSGDHMTVLRPPHVVSLAQALRVALEQSQGSS